MTTDDSELRKEIEQEINSIAAGFNRDELPKNMGILIPSLDLQKSIDRIMQLFAQQRQKVVEECIGKIPKKKEGTINLRGYRGDEFEQIEEDVSIIITFRNGFNSCVNEITAALEGVK